MSNTLQLVTPTRTQTVLEHGEAVLEKYEHLLGCSKEGQLPDGWRLPKWWSPAIAKALANAQPALRTMQTYLVYHDCGKPYCLTIDTQGRRHFPDHANVSADLWERLGGSPEECWLMRHDMVLHSGSQVECGSLKGGPLAPGLLFAAIAEVHANAELFGGATTDSFKAKVKHIERRGRVCTEGLGTETP